MIRCRRFATRPTSNGVASPATRQTGGSAPATRNAVEDEALAPGSHMPTSSSIKRRPDGY